MTKTHLVFLLYFLFLSIYGIAEIYLQVRFSRWKFKREEKGFLFILLPFYLSIYLAPVEHILLKYNLHTYMVLTGFLLLFFAVILRITAMLTIRINFSMHVEAGKDNYLVIHGIYKYIRHPMYLALLLMSVSGNIIFSSRIVWIFFLLTLAGILFRIREEELFLVNQYGEYTDYKQRSYKLIPFIY